MSVETVDIEELKDRIEYLEFFYNNVDFGPAHDDVIEMIDDRFINETGKKIPEAYVWSL